MEEGVTIGRRTSVSNALLGAAQRCAAGIGAQRSVDARARTHLQLRPSHEEYVPDRSQVLDPQVRGRLVVVVALPHRGCRRLHDRGDARRTGGAAPRLAAPRADDALRLCLGIEERIRELARELSVAQEAVPLLISVLEELRDLVLRQRRRRGEGDAQAFQKNR